MFSLFVQLNKKQLPSLIIYVLSLNRFHSMYRRKSAVSELILLILKLAERLASTQEGLNSMELVILKRVNLRRQNTGKGWKIPHTNIYAVS
jgi:hypothetical protein